MSKLSVHINKPSDAAVDFVARGKPRTVVVLLPQCDLAFLKRLKGASPEIRLMGRYFDDDAPVERPAWVAEKFWGHIRTSEAFKQGLIQDWFGPNEIDTTQGDNIYGLCKIDQILGSRLRDAHHRYWMLSTAERQPPDVDNWNWTRDPRFHAAAEVAYGYCVHAYWWSGFGGAGDPLRHQRWYAQLPPSLRKPIFIKECGPDAGVVGQRHKGWQTAYGGDAQAAMADFKKWDDKLRVDPAVLAAAIFCLDNLPTMWWDFALNRSPKLMELLITHMQKGEREMLPDWMVDWRDKAGEHTGYALKPACGILVHHAGSTAPFANQLEYMRKHPCYHFAIDEDQVYYMRDISKRVWHAGDGADGPWNSGGIAVSFLGCYMGSKPSNAMFINLRKLRGWLVEKKGIPDILKGHKDVRMTDCPGDWYPGDEHPDYRHLLLGLGDPTAELHRQIAELKGILQEIAAKALKYS